MNLNMKHSRFLLTCESALLAAVVFALPQQVLCQQGSQATTRMVVSSTRTSASCELASVLGVVAEELRNNPDAIGYILVYRGPDDPPGLFHRHSLGVKNVLVNEEHFAPDRIVIVDGGIREAFVTEYWLAPKDAPPQKRGPVWEGVLQQAKPGKFDEFLLAFETEDLYEYRSDSTRLDGFAQALIRNPSSVGYIIGYADPKTPTLPFLKEEHGKGKGFTRFTRITGKKAASWNERSLIELFKIEPSRVVAIDGGYREFATVELWIVPAGEKAPRPSPTIRRTAK